MSVIHDLPLVSTIAVGLSMAFVCGFIASKLRISPLVGYVIAGIIVGPHSPGFVADLDIAEQLSEIGIVLLLFGVGLHFSIQDFMEVRKIASIGAITRIAIITAAGIGISSLWGWDFSTGLIFGLSLSVASTVILLRALEEHGLLQTITGKIAIGWLIVEDIAMVLAMVMIPALVTTGITEASGSSTGLQLLVAFGKVAIFAIIMTVAGKRILPWLLTAVSRTGSRELFTLAAFSMAMGIAFGAAILFGVSLALGAFFAGMMIRESDLNHEVADRVLPFQDAFAVLFFVSVGMLFDPDILIERPLDVIGVVFVIVPFKAFVTYVIVRAFQYPTRKALLISVGLAQIGEFSFIMIALGASLSIMPAEARDLILAGALISIALNPFLFIYAQKRISKDAAQQVPKEDPLAHLKSEEKIALKNLVLLIGHGRVGQSVVNMMDLEKTDIVIIDNNREKIEALRNINLYALAGDATDRETLVEAGIEKADAVLITVPDPFEARRILEQVKILRPQARILIRSHNDEETMFFQTQNVELAVSATEEIARRMVLHLKGLAV